MVRYAALLLLGCAALAAGCGGANGDASATGLRLEREDLISVAHALQRAQGSVEAEVAAAKTAWPLVVNGLPSGAGARARPPIQAAGASAAKLVVPAPLQEAQARLLTGPAAGIAGLFRSYSGLASHSWRMIVAAIDAIEHGSPAAARFARANVALYIESIYDSHFTLAQIGKRLLGGYRELGDGAKFGAALTAGEVEALTHAYSEPSDRLHPHVGVRLGS